MGRRRHRPPPVTPLTDTEYDTLAAPELRALAAALDALEASLPGDGFEVELAGDVLTVELFDGTRCVVNSHRAARQIWMAAEHQAWHFDWDPTAGAWVAQRTGDELWATLRRLLERRLGRPASLTRSA